MRSQGRHAHGVAVYTGGETPRVERVHGNEGGKEFSLLNGVRTTVNGPQRIVRSVLGGLAFGAGIAERAERTGPIVDEQRRALLPRGHGCDPPA